MIFQKRRSSKASRKEFGMVEFLWTGSMLGAIAGLVHGVCRYHRHAAHDLAIGPTSDRTA
jgi:hypothetical protein